MKLWIVIANSSSAEIFLRKGLNIEKLHHIDFPAGRQRSGEFLSDRPGRGFESGGSKMHGRHAYSSETDIHTQEQRIFAHQLADLLRKAITEKTFDQLAIIAPPEFLGELRRVLPNLDKLLHKEVNKEVSTGLSEHEKIEVICRLLDLKPPVPVRSRG